MYAGVGWEPVFWFGVAILLATAVLCAFFLEETRFDRSVRGQTENVGPEETGMEIQPDPMITVTADEKKVESGEAVPSSSKPKANEQDNGVVTGVPGLAEPRPKVSLGRMMKFVKPLDHSWECVWKGAVQPLIMLRLPAM